MIVGPLSVWFGVVATLAFAGHQWHGVCAHNAAVEAERTAPLNPKLLSQPVALPPCDAQAAGQQTKPTDVQNVQTYAKNVQNPVTIRPQPAKIPDKTPAPEQPVRIEPPPLWTDIYTARKSGKPVLIHFTDSVTCAPCRQSAKLLADPSVIEALRSFACVEIDRAKDPKAFAWYVANVGVTQIPCDHFYGQCGHWIDFGPPVGAFEYSMRLQKAHDFVTTPAAQRPNPYVPRQDPPRLPKRGA